MSGRQPRAADEITRLLSTQDVLELHLMTIERHGGAHGVRDLGLLESAVAMPQQSFEGRELHGDLAAKSAAYLFHIANNHPFVDGNKRTALGACLACIAVNGARLSCSSADLVQLTLGVASGAMGKAELTDWLRARIQRV